MKCTRNDKTCFRCGSEKECLILSSAPDRLPCPFYKPSTINYDASFVKKDYDGIWKKVRGWDGLYWINKDGEIIGRYGIIKQKYRKGRACVILYDDGFRAVAYVEDLVADAFLPGEGKVVFKDGNTLNCKLENLERRK